MQMPESQRVFVGATTKPPFFVESDAYTELHGTSSRELDLAPLTETQDGFFLLFDNVGRGQELWQLGTM